MKKRPRGRPKGHRLSKESKAKIAKTKTGQVHTPETRQKISNTLKQFFKEHPIGIEQRKARSLRMKLYWLTDPRSGDHRIKISTLSAEYQDFVREAIAFYKEHYHE